MKYRNPRALEMAVKEAAKASAMDTNKAIEGFYFDRLLCRIFSEPEPRFILKGGQSMLARTVDARTTRDIDLLSREFSIDSAIDKLKRVAGIDLGDFVRFSFEDCVPIKNQDEYRDGYKVSFQAYLGVEKKQRVSIDLVVDKIVCEQPVAVAPVSRLEIGDLKTFDYLLYPIANMIADKVCAITEHHNGRESSRVKDLVDLAVIFTSMNVDALETRRRIELEARVRKLPPIKSFVVPSSWKTLRKGEFAKLSKETGLPRDLQDLNDASTFVSRCLDPVLDGSEDRKRWNPQLREWQKRA